MLDDVYQFGDFSLHCGRFELCRKGRRLKLERKPLELLVLLVSKRGQIVTREEIAACLWEREVFVDIDQGINTAIRKVRQILDDSSDLPKFVQTVSGSGYRFIASVTAVEPEVTEPGQPSEADRIVRDDATNAHLVEDSRKSLVVRLVIGASVLMACLAFSLWYLHRPLPPPRFTGFTRITDDGHEKLLAGTDGSRLYFTEFQPNTLNQVGIGGGEVAHIQTALPGFFWMVDVSPDGSNLLLTASEVASATNSLWVVPVLGGSPRQIGQGQTAAFSPDGNSIAYFTGSGELWVVQIDGTGKRKLFTAEGRDGLHWSPNGKILRFSRDGDLWEISADGSNLHELLLGWQNRGRECCGRWTPDGKFYLFLTLVSLYRGDKIWALDERRGLFRHPYAEPIQLTSGPLNWRDPIPGKGVNEVFANGKIRRGELCRLDPKTKLLQPFLGGISAQDVSYSKDGRSFAYVSFPDGILWKADRDGSNRVQLSSPPVYATNPRWSPDGSRILFGDYQLHGPNRMNVVSAQGGNPQQLLPDDPGNQNDPGWSADGRRIVFKAQGSRGGRII